MNVVSVEQWRKEARPILLNGYTDDQIYNADETRLFYQCLPNKTLHFRGEKCTGGKRSKNRISILLCTNKSGTDKLKPLVIGKSKNPRCFKNVRSLPVDYKNNQKSWMTSEIFVDFLVGFDARLRREKKKAILLIDNCPSHLAQLPVTLSNLEVKFLPKTRRQNSNRAIWESLRISSATTGNSSFVGCCTTLTQTRTCNGSQTYSMPFT